jgi:hypothetical protein
MRSGLLVSVRPFSPPPWESRSRSFRKFHSRSVVPGSFRLIHWGTTSTVVPHTQKEKAHDWVVDQITDLFRTTHKVKTQQVARNRSQRCGNIEFPGCSPTCGIESFCGDGTLDAVEACDDGIPILETGAHRLVE